jgi:hypothetical protein
LHRPITHTIKIQKIASPTSIIIKRGLQFSPQDLQGNTIKILKIQAKVQIRLLHTDEEAALDSTSMKKNIQ